MSENTVNLSNPVAELFKKSYDNFLKCSPVSMRVVYLLNITAKAEEKGVPDSKIDWNKVYESLTKYPIQYDFNNFEKPENIADLLSIHEKIIFANFDMEFWRKEVCVDCHKTFYLRKGEITFFVSRKLIVPKRCKSCRDARRFKKE